MKLLQAQEAFLNNVKSYVKGWLWAERALCLSEEADFFPHFEPTTHSLLRDIERQREKAVEALNICERCPVKDECYEEHKHEQYGIWGGTVPAQRWKWRSQIDWRNCKCIPCKIRRNQTHVRGKGKNRGI
jgi:Transcription factor WhiB